MTKTTPHIVSIFSLLSSPLLSSPLLSSPLLSSPLLSSPLLSSPLLSSPLLTFLSMLYHQSPSPFVVVLHSPPTLSRSLLTQSSHRILSLPHILFPSTLCASAVFANFCLSHFSLLLTSFFLKTFLHSNLHSQFVHSSLILSLHSLESSYLVVFANLHFLLLFLH